MGRRRTRAASTGLLVAAMVSTGVLAIEPAAAEASAAEAWQATRGTVTLVTGDVVTLGGTDGVGVVPGPGREHVGFHTRTDVDGDTHVIPDDAVAGVSAGRLDPRLFDVTELARTGYGDADRKDVPLIVDYPGATPRTAGARLVRELPSTSAVAVRAEKSPAFWATAHTSAKRIWLDGPVKASLAHSVPQIGAPAAWAAGYTGEGTTVAVLDTGIDTTHPDLDDAVTGAQDFTGSASGTDDRYGHGTHVASIITGSGAPNRGVAPDTDLVNGKVLDDTGSGFESWIIAGMEWAAASGADVVNMSIGTNWLSDGTDPMSLAVNRLTADTGALFVVSAGNNGPGAGTIGSPGAADAALTVGAVDRDDQLAEFSSRGPRYGDGAIKPDVTAPGVDIVAAKAANGQIGTPAGDGYVSLSGTSMAAPHVAGAAAILAGQHPDWPADRLKATLMSSADATSGRSPFEQGAGRVDVAAAVRATVSAAPVSLHLGTVSYPHDDDQPITKTITYTNAGTEPVTLDVAAAVTGPDRNPAPAGMFTVSPAAVSVPAGGTADVTLTADTAVDGAEGAYAGAVVATGGGAVARTPLAVEREVESYDLTLTFLDHNGNPTPMYTFRFVDPEDPTGYFSAYDESGTAVVRVPAGTYFFDGWVVTERAEGNWPTTDLAEPAFVVDGSRTAYTFDARDGVAPGFTVDEPSAIPGLTAVVYRMATDWGVLETSRVWHDFDGTFARPSETSAPGEFTFTVQAKMAKPDGAGGFHASPYLYHLRNVVDGVVPADPHQEARNRELAKVVSSYAVVTPDRIGIRDGLVTMPLPYTLTEYYTPGTEWSPSFRETTVANGGISPDGMYANVFTPRSYELGPTVRERWNTGVFGPGLAYHPEERGTYFARAGDQFRAVVGLWGDRNADVEGDFANPDGTVPPGSTQLLRDGEVIYDSGGPIFFPITLPPEPATYTLRHSVTKPGTLSTKIDAEWTFRSAHVDGEAPEPVPALVVRFAPDLDDHNAARAGEKFRIPLYVQRNGVEAPGRVNTPTVEISYDDGKTWCKARVSRHDGQWLAEVDHPAKARFASLRWLVSDRAGNKAKATIIHAYALTN